ncbi:MAG TPA: hypothetical protein VMZ28_00050 [Kofleriaceae bacterium]|nr:hypothetical protein [Kofleriaceae bacterium]
MSDAARRRWASAAHDDLEEARQASDARSLSDRAEEAFRLYCLSIAELARRVATDEELFALLDREPGASPSTRKRG